MHSHYGEHGGHPPARNVANYQLTSESGSYHVLVDTTGHRLRENTDGRKTWSTGNRGNDVLLHISFVFYAAATRAQWLAQDKMLRAGATVVAHWCKEHNFPVKKSVPVSQLPGITTHDATRAWGYTDHTDPGPNFPWDVFLRYVEDGINGTPKPTTPATITKGDGMSDQKLDTLISLSRSNAARLKAIEDQLMGPEQSDRAEADRNPKGGRGWPQLGSNKDGLWLTLIDAVAALRQDVATLMKERNDGK